MLMGCVLALKDTLPRAKVEGPGDQVQPPESSPHGVTRDAWDSSIREL